MFRIHRIVKGAAVTLVAALSFIMIVWAHGRSAPQQAQGKTTAVRAVQLRFTFDGHWANVTEVEGGAFTIERDGKKLTVSPYIREGGNVELQVFKVIQNGGKETMEAASTLLVGKGLTKFEVAGLVMNVQVLDANKRLSSELVAAAGATCCVRACNGTLFCGVCVCTDCGRCGPNWCDCAIPGPSDVS
jgi:hypothetical protein